MPRYSCNIIRNPLNVCALVVDILLLQFLAAIWLFRSRDDCKLPNCFRGESIPGGFHLSEIPQFVLVTFEGSVNDHVKSITDEIFDGRRENPDQSSIKGTFFVDNKRTILEPLKELHGEGHEIADYTVSRLDLSLDIGDRTREEEIVAQRLVLAKALNVEANYIRGFRAPYLKSGGDETFLVLNDSSFLYDSSLPSKRGGAPIWPYTLHYGAHKGCRHFPCPSRRYPDLWEVPLTPLTDDSDSDVLVKVSDVAGSFDATLEMLHENLRRHSTSNRAPLTILLDAKLLRKAELLEAVCTFLDEALATDYVFVTTISKTIDWIKNPKPLGHMKKKS